MHNHDEIIIYIATGKLRIDLHGYRASILGQRLIIFVSYYIVFFFQKL